MSIIDMSMSPSENQGLADLMHAADCVFNNDIAKAEELLNGRGSSFGKLGQALVVLLKRSLGFEGIWAKHAAQALIDAEKIAGFESRKISSIPDRGGVAIFPPGSAHALCQAQAQFSAAVVAILNQGMFEYMRGLYKIRQSYMILKKLADLERQRVKEEKTSSRSDLGRHTKTTKVIEDDNVYSLSHQLYGRSAPGSTSDSGGKKQVSFLHSPDSEEADQVHDIRTPQFTLPSDQYTYTGTYLCFGLMLVGLGMVPSAFQYILRVVGFRGQKERGMAMLWEASKFRNAHGALAALLLFSIYNVLRAVCDILDGEAYPKKRCENLLAEMSARYPESVFWILEQSRTAAAQGDLKKSIVILSKPLHDPPKQLMALILIEKTMYQMYTHDYAACTEGFIKYTSETNYSHALYYYNAGCAQVELYRALLTLNPSQAQIHKTDAKEYFQIASVGVDKTKLMATELPFDNFVMRKVNKWKAKAEKFNVDLIDAVGPSPMEEMIYYHGGHKWMTSDQLEQSLTAITRCTSSPLWEREAADERCIYALLKGVVRRMQGNLEEAKQQFAQIHAQNRTCFSGKLDDNWVQPSAHYESAIVAWNERHLAGVDAATKLEECSAQLDKVSRWGSYELDARLITRVKVAQDVVNAARAAQ